MHPNTVRIYEQLRVIRSLRGAHYSMNAILRLLQHIHEPTPNVYAILNTPSSEEDIVYVTDKLGEALQQAIEDAETVLAYLQQTNNSRVYRS